MKLLAIFMTSAYGMLIGGHGRPAYLGVPGWQKCTEVQDMGGWQGVCLPAAPKEDCPEGSHGQLANLNGQIPNCK